MTAKLYLIASGVYVTAAWIIPVLKMKIPLKDLGTLTISVFAEGEYKNYYQIFLLLADITLFLYLYLEYPLLPARLAAIVMLISAISFIFITLKKNFLLHNISAFIFYLILSVICAVMTKNILRFIPVIILLALIIQLRLFKKGDGLSILLLGYSAWLSLLLE